MTHTLQPEALDGSSLDISADKRQQLKAMFPSVFTETRNAEGAVVESIDFERLKAELGTFSEVFESRKERFGLDWPGKADCMKVIQQPSTGTLLPMRDESVNFDSSENLIIEGDNLEVLKLLQKSYYGKVKMIYIDPPYNTGNEFIYPDNFHEGLDEYLRYSGQVDAEGRKQSANTETSGRYHSNWLSMMYPRLFLAKNLLRDDGVIFVSIDDHEVHNLRLLMNEIFGEESFIASICHKSRASISNDKIISSNHNSILFYAKDGGLLHAKRALFGLAPDLDGFNKSDDRGSYKLVPVDGPGGAAKGNPYYEFLGVSGYFRFSKERMQEKYSEGRIVRSGNTLQQKLYLDDAKNTRKTDTTWWDDKMYTSTATSRLKELLGGDYFDNPKPVDLIRKMLQLHIRNNGDLVIDFFAGSATTGHAVAEQNTSDGIKRNFIIVQLPEPCPIDSNAYKAGYKNIAEISRDRLRKYFEKQSIENIGFRAFKLAASNFKVWSSDPAKVSDLGKSLQLFADHVTANRQAEDILYELLLKAGYPLTAAIEKLTLTGKEVFSVSDGALLICLDRRLTLEVIDAMVARTPAMILCLDDGFRGNDQLKVNAVQTVKSRNQNDETDIVFRVV